MNFWYLLFMCISMRSGVSSGLRCWQCENARSPTECMIKGHSQQCQPTEKACQTEVRYSSGWERRANIRTSCKEVHACGDNFQQNPRSAWSPTQCNGETDNSVCRCCCNGFHCNKQTLLCQPRDSRVCGAISVPENGAVDCTASKEVGKATCVFRCNDGYQLVGSRTTSCIDKTKGPEWSHDVPTCTVTETTPTSTEATPIPADTTTSSTIAATTTTPKCPELGKLPNGEIKCTHADNRVGTSCSFQCNDDYQLIPSNRTHTECEATSDGKAKWSKKKPCCSNQCPPIAKKDVVLIIDSSKSVNIHQWITLRNFLADLIRSFNVSSDAVRVAAFTFSDIVKTETQIFFDDYNDTEILIEKVKSVGRIENGTNIGNALKHAQNTVLPVNNRPDVSDMIFVVTDGKSEDPFSETAKELRDSGVQIVALGVFGTDRKKVIPQLVEMTGDKDSVFEVKGFVDFKDDLLKQIVEKMCELSCNE